MKVLQINCLYKQGSTGKIVFDIHNTLLGKGIDSRIAYGRGIRKKEEYVFKFCYDLEAYFHTLMIRSGLILNYGGLLIPTLRLISYIKKERPDIVHLHCLNGSCVNIYMLAKYLALNKYKTIVTNHAEFYYTGSCGYSFDCNKFMREKGCGNCPRKFESTRSVLRDTSSVAWLKMKKSFSRFNRNDLLFTAVSPWVKNRFAMSPITKDYDCRVVLNGLDVAIFRYNGSKKIQEELKTSRKIALYVSAAFNPLRKDDIKGGYYIVELAKKMPDIIFVVVSLKNGKYDELPCNIVIWGNAKNQDELADLYNSADIVVLPSKKETFSMICAESLCCGTPVVGFKSGGPETITISEYSSFVDYGNLDALSMEVSRRINQRTSPEDISNIAREKYSKEKMTLSYLDLYNELMSS